MNRNRLLIGIGLGALAMTILATRKTEDSIRQQVINAALAEQAAPDPVKYWNDVLVNPSSKPTSWCGALALYAIHRAGLGLDIHWVIGKGFLYNLHQLPPGEDPKPGDVAYFDKYQHQALVKSVNDDGTVTVINGNAEGGAITVTSPARSKIAAFYSLQPLLAKVL
jgi:hypothetical protein